MSDYLLGTDILGGFMIAPPLDEVRKGFAVAKRGMKGLSVEAVNDSLGLLHGDEYTAQTEAAVAMFQSALGIASDGVVGKDTLAPLETSSAQILAAKQVVRRANDAGLFAKIDDVDKAAMIAAWIGFFLAGTGGALLWTSHRVIGFLVGALLVGAPAGGSMGRLIAQERLNEQFKEIK